MKLIYVFFFFCIINQTYGQQKELELIHNCQGRLSGFATVKVIDKRDSSGKQMIGIVQKGALNKPVKVVFNGELTDSLAAFFIDQSANSNPLPLVLILNELFISEAIDNMTEIGRFRLSLRLFIGKQSDQYSEIVAIDSLYTVKGLDVTKKLLRSISEQFCKISQLAAEKQPILDTDAEKYTFKQLHYLDSLEKMKLPMYQTDHPSVGLYKNYKEFKQNTPGVTAELSIEERKNGFRVYIWDEKRKNKTKLPSTGLYAVSDGTTLLRATPLGFFKILKKGGDFYYWRPQVNKSHHSLVPAAYMYGALGGLVYGLIEAASAGNNKWLLQKINYRKGSAAPVSWTTAKEN
ncbi:hypothetical protein WBJ53_15165 [Spirosoma sp. SC4-14]|uniref:hypothetical protein n=1 Tax=Spirosoma sp. SC4-14 TaxID=3128900 RepID=UPI0030CD6899